MGTKAMTLRLDGTITGIHDCFDSIWQERLHEYDDCEVHGVVNLNAECDADEKGTCCEVQDEANPPHFYSAYLHLITGGVECIGDFTKYADAEKYAQKVLKLVKEATR